MWKWAGILGGQLLACAALAGFAAPVRAACEAGRAESQGESSGKLEEAFEQALARDKYADSAGQARRWRELLAQATQEGGVAPVWQLRGQTRLAWVLDYSNQAEAALEEGERALALIARHDLAGSPEEGEALTVMATILTDAGQVARAGQSARRALAIVESLFGARSAQASFAHNGLGTVAYAQGRYGEAEREYAAAASLAVVCLPAEDPSVVNQLASHAGTLFMTGELDAARDEARRAASWAGAHLPEDSPLQTLALGNYGAILLVTGRFVEAEKALRRVVDLEATFQPDSWYYRAVSLSNYAGVLRHLGRLEEAEGLWLKAAEFHAKANLGRDPTSPSFPLRNAADAAQARGDLGLALARRDAAVGVLDEAVGPQDPERARAHLERALTRLAMGDVAAALAEADPAMPILRAGYGESDIRRMPLEIGYARILARSGRGEEAYERAKGVAVRLEERLLDAATSRGDLVRFGAAFDTSFRTMTQLALHTGRAAEAFHYLQLANLSQIVVVTSEVAARAAATNAKTSLQIRDFQDRLRRREALSREHSFALSSGEGARAAALSAEIARNDMEIAGLGGELDRIAPQLRTLGRPTPVALSDYRARLGKGEALVAPVLLEDGTLTVVVTREGLRWAESKYPGAEVSRWIAEAQRSVDPGSPQAIAGHPPAFAYRAARKLHLALLPEGLSDAIAGHPDLVYFAGGDLAGLPLALLIAGDEGLDAEQVEPADLAWLVREHSVRIAPSLVPFPPRRTGARHPRRFLGIGAPVPTGFEGGARDSADVQVDVSDLAPLPGAAQELATLADVFGERDSTLLLGARANEAALRALPLEDYAILAFATHGLGGGERAGLDEPALVLSRGADGDDGLLTASEIMGLRLDADWVVLSACNTAGGISAGAPIFGGLASAFVHAGARALLVAHWPVRDDMAERLVVRAMTENARGVRAARALQRAQLELISDRSLAEGAEPRHWAAMVLVDD